MKLEKLFSLAYIGIALGYFLAIMASIVLPLAIVLGIAKYLLS